MAGAHSGVQERIHELNSKALFAPCANHSLDFSGKHSFGVNATCVTFFGTLWSIYTFFSSSCHRWNILTEIIGVAVKKLSDTKWSAQYNAVKPIIIHFEKLVEAIEKLCESTENTDNNWK